MDPVSRVDVARESALLGWENYDYDMVEDVREIPGHHFNVFSEPHIEVATREIELACNKLEGISRSQEMDRQSF
jgi:thioesterase domain-containing protein